VPLDGHVEAIAALVKAHPEIDGSRVGVYGASSGGYFAALAVLVRPDVLAAAAAYDAASLLTAAKEAPKGGREPALGIAHGTADDNVYFSRSLELVDALAKAGRPFTFLPMSGQTHRFAAPEAVYAGAAAALRKGLAR